MAQVDKELLLKDICARLPYGVYVLVHDTFEYSTTPYENVYLKSSDISSLIDSISLNERYNSKDKQFNRIIKEHKDFLEFKQYLRPMSSMTEEEKKEVSILLNYEFYIDDDCALAAEDDRHRIRLDLMQVYIDWLNSHHFDYHGLIEKNLAIAVTEENNPYKE